MKKRLLALVMAVAMIAGLVAGCTDNKPQGSNPTNPPVQTKAPDDKTPDPTKAPEQQKDPLDILTKDTSISGKVRFWMPFKETQGMGALIKEFNEMYPNIEIAFTTFNNNADGNMAVNTAIMAGEVDVLGSFGLQYAYLRWANGLYQDITDRINAEGIDLVANWGTDVYGIDGHYYSFPAGGLSYAVAINMDDWNAANLGALPTEWTWDEYLEVSRKLTKTDANGAVTTYGGSDHSSIESALLPKVQVTGQDQCYDETTGLSVFNMPIVSTILERKAKAELVDKIWFPLSVYRADSVKAHDLLKEHRVATVITENLHRFLADQENYNMGFKVGYAPYPVEEKGQVNHMSGVRTFSHYGITQGCQDVEASWVFLKWLATEGSKYLGAAGHCSVWKGTDPNALASICFGSEERAATIVDLESFKRCVANASNPGSVDTIVTANADVTSIAKKHILAAMNEEYSVAEAIQKAKDECDAAIKAEQ